MIAIAVAREHSRDSTDGRTEGGRDGARVAVAIFLASLLTRFRNPFSFCPSRDLALFSTRFGVLCICCPR